MNILFLSLAKIDSINERGIYTDLLREFDVNGHTLSIVSPREKRMNLPTEYEVIDCVEYLRIKTGNITKSGLLEKGIATLLLESNYLKAIKKHLSKKKFDLILYSTPPISFEKVVNYVKRRDNAKTYLLLKDIFPQNAVDLGIFSKRSLFYKYYRKKEKRLYTLSNYIGCMSQANVNYVLRHNPYLAKDSVEMCPNSIEPIHFDVNENQVKMVKDRYNIPTNKIVFIYGGNLGKPQGVDFLMKCIEWIEYSDDIFFIVVGSGTEFNTIDNFFNKKNPRNALLLDYLPKDEFDKLVASCDVGLIFLDRRFTIPNFPSRLLSYMEAAIPIVACTDRNSDVREVIEENSLGYWCEHGDLEAFKYLIGKLRNPTLLTQMGLNARRYLEGHYTSKHSYEIIMKHFQDEKDY
jgi:glycosyltransferase involved in cell wall biosynthesis